MYVCVCRKIGKNIKIIETVGLTVEPAKPVIISVQLKKLIFKTFVIVALCGYRVDPIAEKKTIHCCRFANTNFISKEKFFQKAMNS